MKVEDNSSEDEYEIKPKRKKKIRLKSKRGRKPKNKPISDLDEDSELVLKDLGNKIFILI